MESAHTTTGLPVGLGCGATPLAAVVVAVDVVDAEADADAEEETLTFALAVGLGVDEGAAKAGAAVISTSAALSGTTDLARMRALPKTTTLSFHGAMDAARIAVAAQPGLPLTEATSRQRRGGVPSGHAVGLHACAACA